jgi:pyruvate dehydrogenase (quinone)
MGSGVPYALAAKFCHPTRAVIGIVGDGAMQMNGINELITVAKYWKEWADPRLVILVLNNRDLNMVTWEERVLAGDPKFEASQNLPDIGYADYAKLLGLAGVRVDQPEQVGRAWEAALSSDRPFVIDAVTDPNVPPLPPHLTMEEAKSFASSVLKGDVDALGFLKQTIRQVAARYLPKPS